MGVQYSLFSNAIQISDVIRINALGLYCGFLDRAECGSTSTFQRALTNMIGDLQVYKVRQLCGLFQA